MVWHCWLKLISLQRIIFKTTAFFLSSMIDVCGYKVWYHHEFRNRSIQWMVYLGNLKHYLDRYKFAYNVLIFLLHAKIGPNLHQPTRPNFSKNEQLCFLNVSENTTVFSLCFKSLTFNRFIMIMIMLTHWLFALN